MRQLMHSERHAEQQPAAELPVACLKGGVQGGQRRDGILTRGVVAASEQASGQLAVYISRASRVS